MKLSFKEFSEWHDEEWPHGFIWSGNTLLPDGRDIYDEANGLLNKKIDPETLVDTSLWEGLYLETDSAVVINIEPLIARWRKKLKYQTVIVKIPKHDLEKFKNVCKLNKWRLQ